MINNIKITLMIWKHDAFVLNSPNDGPFLPSFGSSFSHQLWIGLDEMILFGSIRILHTIWLWYCARAGVCDGGAAPKKKGLMDIKGASGLKDQTAGKRRLSAGCRQPTAVSLAKFLRIGSLLLLLPLKCINIKRELVKRPIKKFV